MATADQMKALVKSHADGDDDRFYSVALQVAAQASRSGHTKLARDLRDMVDRLRAEATGDRAAGITPLARPTGELASLLTVSYPKLRLSSLSFQLDVMRHLTELVTEHRNKSVLANHGLKPASKILFVGPPGTGKTSSAKSIASELALPLFTVRLESMLSRYLGESAAKLSLVFDSIQEVPGVYLFDEVDALAGSRNNPNDVGEMRRFLNTFLILLDQSESSGPVIAATNHMGMLDSALFRRFEDTIAFPLPDDRVAEDVLRSVLAGTDTSRLNWEEAVERATGLSHSDLSLAAAWACRRAVLYGQGQITTRLLLEGIDLRLSLIGQDR